MDDDFALIGFLNLLDRDIAAHREHLRPVPGTLLKRGQDLVRGLKIDLDAPLWTAAAVPPSVEQFAATGVNAEQIGCFFDVEPMATAVSKGR